MSNLYEKQALDNYLNDGITHGKKISYGSLGRTRNEIRQRPVNNSERQPIIMNSTKKVTKQVNNSKMQPIIMNSKPNVTKHVNNPKMNVKDFLHNIKMYNTKQKHFWLQKLTKKECEIWTKLNVSISDNNIYLAEPNASSECQVNKLDTHEIHE